MDKENLQLLTEEQINDLIKTAVSFPVEIRFGVVHAAFVMMVMKLSLTANEAPLKKFKRLMARISGVAEVWRNSEDQQGPWHTFHIEVHHRGNFLTKPILISTLLVLRQL